MPLPAAAVARGRDGRGRKNHFVRMCIDLLRAKFDYQANLDRMRGRGMSAATLPFFLSLSLCCATAPARPAPLIITCRLAHDAVRREIRFARKEITLFVIKDRK